MNNMMMFGFVELLAIIAGFMISIWLMSILAIVLAYLNTKVSMDNNKSIYKFLQYYVAVGMAANFDMFKEKY